MFDCIWRAGWICAGIFLLAGCISHSETTYRNVERVPVRFESEKAGRIFYDALNKMPCQEPSESQTEIEIPLIFKDKCTVKCGENEKFNEAVRRCDTNKDGMITELEAGIFASQFH